MKNDKSSTTTTEDTLTSIDTIALDEVTGGCGACGQRCANGTPPAGAPNNAAFLAASFSAFSRR